MGYCYVIFTGGNLAVGSKRDRFWGRIIRVLGRSRFEHIDIANDYWVLHHGWKGDKLFPLDSYMAHYPGILCIFKVPHDNPEGLYSWANRCHEPAWRTISRWLLRGRVIEANDCITIAIQYLRHGGAEIPRHLYNVQQVHDWLRAQNYERLCDAKALDGHTARQFVVAQVAG